jgi:spore germination protein KC
MKRIAILVLSVLFLGGCSVKEFVPRQSEIENMAIIQMLSIDSEDNGGMSLSLMKRDIQPNENQKENTASLQGAENGGEKSNSKSAKENPLIKASGKTFALCEEILQQETEKNIFFGDLKYCLFGESCAKNGLYKYMDYISRDTRFRTDTLVFLTKGRADGLLKKSSSLEFFLPDYLNVFFKNEKFTSATNKKTFINLFSECFDDEGISVMPVMELSSGKNPMIFMDSYAVIKDFKLYCFIEKEEAKGYNILINEFDQDNVTVLGAENENVDLSLISLECFVIPKVKKGKISHVDILCEAESNILEDSKRTDYSNEENIKLLEERLSEKIKKYLTLCVEKSKKEKCDFINLYKTVRAFHGNIYYNHKSDWNNFYSKLKFKIHVASEIRRGFDSRERGKK